MRGVAVLLAMAIGGVTAAHSAPHTRRVPLQATPRTVWDSVYSAEQATRGQASYLQSCARCHQASLGGADESPALTGGAFLANWNGQTLGDMLERIRTTMPTNDPGTFARPLIADVMAYVLKVNGFPAGAAELPADTESLKEIRLETARPPRP
jgi:quinoprotein glucose dehydrogenase